MSLFTDGMTKVFPVEWIKHCIAEYTKNNGKAPKILVLAQEDYVDYKLNCTLTNSLAASLGLKVVPGSYLKSGEIDLALGLKDEVQD